MARLGCIAALVLATACGHGGGSAGPTTGPATPPTAPAGSGSDVSAGSGSAAPAGSDVAQQGPAAECEVKQCGPAMKMPNKQCKDGSMGGPTGKCLKHADGSCGWEVHACPP